MAWQGVVCWGVDKEGKRKLGKGRLAQNFGQHQLLSQFFLVQPFHRPKAVLYKVLFTCLPISFVFHQNKNKAQGATENVLGKNVREDPFALTPPTFGHCPNRIWPTHSHSTGHSEPSEQAFRPPHPMPKCRGRQKDAKESSLGHRKRAPLAALFKSAMTS